MVTDFPAKKYLEWMLWCAAQIPLQGGRIYSPSCWVSLMESYLLLAPMGTALAEESLLTHCPPHSRVTSLWWLTDQKVHHPWLEFSRGLAEVSVKTDYHLNFSLYPILPPFFHFPSTGADLNSTLYKPPIN